MIEPVGFLFFQILAMALPVGALGLFGYLAVRFLRVKEREAALRGAAVQSDAKEIARLEEAIAGLQSEVNELREHQQFLERLLEKPRPSPTS